MSSFMIMLIIVAIVFYKAYKKSQAQKKKFAQQQKQNTSHNPTASHSAPRRTGQMPKDDILTRSKKNVAEDFGNSSEYEKAKQTKERLLKKQQKHVSAPAAVENPVSTPTADSVNISHKTPNGTSVQTYVPSDNFMKELQDLMVKGYEPKMTFERDFISEGMDLINNYYH